MLCARHPDPSIPISRSIGRGARALNTASSRLTRSLTQRFMHVLKAQAQGFDLRQIHFPPRRLRGRERLWRKTLTIQARQPESLLGALCSTICRIHQLSMPSLRKIDSN